MLHANDSADLAHYLRGASREYVQRSAVIVMLSFAFSCGPAPRVQGDYASLPESKIAVADEGSATEAHQPHAGDKSGDVDVAPLLTPADACSYFLQLSGPVDVRTAYGVISAEVPDEECDSRHRALILQELLKFPREFIYRIDLHGIYPCKSLCFNGVPWGGLVEFESRTIYLDTSWASGLPEYARRVFHHELFHLLDFTDDGKIYEDVSWARLNSEEFRYQRGPRVRGAGELTHNEGFLNRYSMYGVEEDKAELFAFAMTDLPTVLSRARSDAFLGRKWRYMKRLLQHFCSDMNDDYWIRAK